MNALPTPPPELELLTAQLEGEAPSPPTLQPNELAVTLAGLVGAQEAQGIDTEFPEDITLFRLNHAQRAWALESLYPTFAAIRAIRGSASAQYSRQDFVKNVATPTFEDRFMQGMPQERLDSYRPHIQKVISVRSLYAKLI